MVCIEENNVTKNILVIILVIVLSIGSLSIVNLAPTASAIGGVGDETMWSWNIGDQMDKILSGDLDNDGKDEVAVLVQATSTVYGIDDDGTSMWSFMVSDRSFNNAGGGNNVGNAFDIALGDVDNDKNVDVIIGTDRGWMGVLNGNDGTLIDALNPFNSQGDMYVVAADLDGAGGYEIVVADRNDNREIYAYELTGGALSDYWGGGFDVDWYFQNNWPWKGGFEPRIIAAADVDNDGNDEPIFGTRTRDASGALRTFVAYLDENNGNMGDYLGYLTDYDKAEARGLVVGDLTATIGDEFAIVALNSVLTFEVDNGGNIASIWTKSLTDAVRAVDIADADNQGREDVVYAGDNGKVIFANGGNGNQIWSKQYIDGSWIPNDGVKAFDADGDGSAEVALAEGDNALIVLNSTGTEVWRLSANTQRGISSADLDGDGNLEVVGIGTAANTVSGYDGIWERPILTITSPIEGSVVDSSINVITSGGVDPDGLIGAYLYVDGVAVNLSTTSPFTMVLDTRSLTDGWHSLALISFDAMGNYNDSPLVKVLVDNDPPSKALITPAPGDVVEGSVTIYVEATDVATGVKSVEFSIDGNSEYVDTTSPYLWSWDTWGFADGTHGVEITVADGNGHVSRETMDLIVDNLGPDLIITSPVDGDVLGGLQPVVININDIGTEIALVEFSIDNMMRHTVSKSPYSWTWNTNESSSGEHIISVSAVDTSGNWATRSIRVTVDNTLPALKITEPIKGTVIRGDMNVAASLDEGQFVEAVDFRITMDSSTVLEGALVKDLISGLYIGNVDTTSLDNGDYRITVTATGTTGWSVSDQLNISIDNSVLISYPRENHLIEGDIEVIAISMGVPDIESMTLWLDGTAHGTMYSISDNSYGFHLDTADLIDGSHKIEVIASGKFGAIGRDNVTIDVDNSVPVVEVGSPLEGDHVRGTIEVNATATDTPSIDDLVSEYTVDGASWAALGTALNTNWLNDGTHTLTVRAIDRHGHEATSSVTFVIDNTAPSLSISDPIDQAILRGTFRLQVAVTEGLGISSVVAIIGDENASSMPMALDKATGFYFIDVDTKKVLATDGPATITVKAMDIAGNSGRTSIDITADNSPPEITVLSSTRQTGVVRVKVRVEDQYSKVESILIRMQGRKWKEMALTKDGDHFYNWKETTEKDNGKYTFEIKVADGLGNEDIQVYTLEIINPDYSIYILMSIVLVLIIIGLIMFKVLKRKKKVPEQGPAGPRGPYSPMMGPKPPQTHPPEPSSAPLPATDEHPPSGRITIPDAPKFEESPSKAEPPQTSEKD